MSKPLTLRCSDGPASQSQQVAQGPHLVAVVDVGVRELPRHELIQHDAVGVDVRLEAERVVSPSGSPLSLQNQVHLSLGTPAIQE